MSRQELHAWMVPEPPFVLRMPGGPSVYATLMGVLLSLFVLRVLGQGLAATVAPRWLPPMARWYSGLMPYRYLLPAQLVIVTAMTAMTAALARHTGALGTPNADAGRLIVWASYVYALGMVARSARYVAAPVERRGVLIPIVFHFVLAGFLFVYGSWLVLSW